MNQKKLLTKLGIFFVLAVIAVMLMFRGGGTAPGPGTPEPAQTQAPVLQTIAPESPAPSSSAAQTGPAAAAVPETSSPAETEVTEDGTYTDRDSVALYLHLYGHLPSNFLTKKEAQEAGWDSSKGNLPTVLPGMSIGGDRFGNYEKLLPAKKGRSYRECDINYNPKGKKKASRGAERIVWSNDGLIYYTDDHYRSFTLLYGEP